MNKLKWNQSLVYESRGFPVIETYQDDLDRESLAQHNHLELGQEQGEGVLHLRPWPTVKAIPHVSNQRIPDVQ